MKKHPAYLMAIMLCAALGLAAASCNSKTAAPQKPAAAPQPQNTQQGSPAGPGQGMRPRDGRSGRGARDGRGPRGDRDALRDKIRQLCGIDSQHCKTIRDMRRDIKTHCDSNPDLCIGTRPEVRDLTDAALDSCIKDNTGCAQTLKKLDKQVSDLIKMR
jgi:hypothetical protein